VLLISGAYEFLNLNKKHKLQKQRSTFFRVLISSYSGKLHKNLMEKLNKYIDIDEKKLLEQRGKR